MADLLLRRARIGGAVADVRIESGRIAAIGSGSGAGPLRTVDLDGREVLRGFWDEHVHVTQAALASVWTPLGGIGSAAAVLDRVREVAAGLPPEEPLVAIGFQDGTWVDRPTLAGLDAAVGPRVALLISHDVHTVWLSSAAARRYGIDLPAEGVVREGAAFALGREANRLAEARVEDAVRNLMTRASTLGVVGIVDFEMTWSRDAWIERMAGGWQGPRIEAAVYPPDLDRAIALGGRTGEAVAGADGPLAVGPLKMLADGALNTRTAFCADAYPDGGNGLLTLGPAELRDLLRRGGAAGLAPAVHAIGDAAITVALDAFAETGATGRIEHAQLVADADLPRFAALGAVASVQPVHLLDDREVAGLHWAGRTGRAYPFRALLDAGATLAFGSDAPVAPLDPWRALRAAVDRALPREEPWHPEQRIGLQEALAASTRGRAEPRAGDLADLVVLDEPVERLAGQVAATLVGGGFTHHTFSVG